MTLFWILFSCAWFAWSATIGVQNAASGRWYMAGALFVVAALHGAMAVIWFLRHAKESRS